MSSGDPSDPHALSPDPVPPDPIVTPRLILRGRSPADAAALFPLFSDPDIMTWWSRPPFESVEELRADFAVRDQGSWQSWAITRKPDDRAIGFVSTGERRSGVWEIGYLLSRDWQGQGLASEAVSGMIDRLFGTGQRRVFADTDPDNLASIALLGRLGFTLEGRLRQAWHTHIGVRDSLIFGLLADEWRS